MKTLNIVLGLLLVSSLQANAEAIGSAYLGPLTYTLVDLDENDGITPSILFTPYNSMIQTSVGAHNVSEWYENSLTTLGDLSHQITTSALQSSASVNASDYASMQLSISGSAHGDGGANPTFYQYGSFYANASQYSGFTLSANTQVVFSIFASIEAENTGPVVSYHDLGLRESVFTRAGFFAGINDSNIGGGEQIDVQTFNWDTPLPGDEVAPARQYEKESQYITASLSNLMFESVNGVFTFFAYTNGISPFAKADEPVSAVPVPAALPLMASALMLIGFARRREK